MQLTSIRTSLTPEALPSRPQRRSPISARVSGRRSKTRPVTLRVADFGPFFALFRPHNFSSKFSSVNLFALHAHWPCSIIVCFCSVSCALRHFRQTILTRQRQNPNPSNESLGFRHSCRRLDGFLCPLVRVLPTAAPEPLLTRVQGITSWISIYNGNASYLHCESRP